MSVFKLDNVSLKFKDKYLIKEFSLEIERGDKVLLFGRSGIGKSSIIKLLLGFTRPEKGKIYFYNDELGPDNVWELRKKTAYVSQDVDIGEGDIACIIEQIFSYKRNKDIDYRDELEKCIEYFHLEQDVLTKEFKDLSGGEKQRIAIIIAIILKRDIFLLDEITSSLDLELKRKVQNYFLNRDHWTEIIISHDKTWLHSDKVKIIELEG